MTLLGSFIAKHIPFPTHLHIIGEADVIGDLYIEKARNIYHVGRAEMCQMHSHSRQTGDNALEKCVLLGDAVQTAAIWRSGGRTRKGGAEK